MENLSLNKQNLKKFGITMGIVLLLIAIFMLIRHKQNALPLSIIAAIFLAAAIIAPVLLKPVYIAWMRFAAILGWVNTRLLLVSIFYLIFTPLGLVMRLFGADLLDRRIAKQKTTYWKKKHFDLVADYEKQF